MTGGACSSTFLQNELYPFDLKENDADHGVVVAGETLPEKATRPNHSMEGYAMKAIKPILFIMLAVGALALLCETLLLSNDVAVEGLVAEGAREALSASDENRSPQEPFALRIEERTCRPVGPADRKGVHEQVRVAEPIAAEDSPRTYIEIEFASVGTSEVAGKLADLGARAVQPTGSLSAIFEVPAHLSNTLASLPGIAGVHSIEAERKISRDLLEGSAATEEQGVSQKDLSG